MKDRADKLLMYGEVSIKTLNEVVYSEDEMEGAEEFLQEKVDQITDIFNEDEEVVIYCLMKLWLKKKVLNYDFVKAYVDNIDFVGKMQNRFEKLC